mgnify:CR=1 FL=1|tara:strand:- start:42778 stop:43341 length:564 start_codon:yes stop_codon:yes gene_type:complete
MIFNPLKNQINAIILLTLALLPLSAVGQTEQGKQEPLSYLNLPLQPRSESTQSRQTASQNNYIPGFNESMVRMFGSLAVVLSLFLGFVWVVKKKQGRSRQPLNQNMLTVIGQTHLTKDHTLHVVKLGERLLLVSAGESKVTCLTELTDPVEIEQLLAHSPNKTTDRPSFKKLFAQYDQDAQQLFTDS